MTKEINKKFDEEIGSKIYKYSGEAEELCDEIKQFYEKEINKITKEIMKECRRGK